MTALKIQAIPSQIDPFDPAIFRPSASRWPGLLLGAAQRRPAHCDLFRRELGLPTDRPVVMTGHQAQFWHPGILAKYLAADALALRTHAAAAWIIVDQDTNAPGVIRLPVRRPLGARAERALRTETWVIDPAAAREQGDIPTGRQPPLHPGPPPTLQPGEAWAAPGVAPGIELIRAALADHAAAPSAADQLGGALADLLLPVIHARAHRVLSTSISRTSLFREIIKRLHADPGACVDAYNAAVAAHPRERIQPLGPGELPLWSIAPGRGGARRRTTIDDLAAFPAEDLAPRALLMTGLLRCAACDLFIHGTGGGGGGGEGGGSTHDGYDRITEQWFGAWFGKDPVELAPAVVATATLRLNIEHGGPGAESLRQAQWLAHRALHEPRLLGDLRADDGKRTMVDRIRELKRTGADARPLYREMHALLETVRTGHGPELDRLRAAAAAASGQVGDAEIAADRTWAFPLYEPAQLAALRARVGAAFDQSGVVDTGSVSPVSPPPPAREISQRNS